MSLPARWSQSASSMLVFSWGDAGPADDELWGKGEPPRRAGRVPPPAEQHAERFFADLVDRLPDGGELGVADPAEGGVVDAGDRDVVGDPDAGPPQLLHRAQRDQVVAADQRIRQRLSRRDNGP